MSHDSRRHRSERGQSLVEMALAVPILILLLAAMIDASRIFDALIVLTQAVREGARFATTQPAPGVPQIQTLVVQDVVGSGTNITHMDMVTDCVDVDIGQTAITVTAWYTFPLWFGGMLGVPEIRVTREAVMPLYYPEGWGG